MVIIPCRADPPILAHTYRSLCPFVHPNEKARRRDPRLYSYQPLPCPFDKKVRHAACHGRENHSCSSSVAIMRPSSGGCRRAIDAPRQLLLTAPVSCALVSAGCQLPAWRQLQLHSESVYCNGSSTNPCLVIDLHLRTQQQCQPAAYLSSQ
jgi:hypothetical protein